MININFLHKSNPDGEALLNCLLLNFSSVNANEIQINGESLLNITIKCCDPPLKRIINSPAALNNCMSRDTIYRILKINGVPFSKTDPHPITAYFDILIFDLTVISLRHVLLISGKKRVVYAKAQTASRAAELAQKAAYHVGLDYAMVRVGLFPGRNYLVLDVNPSPGHIRPKDLTRIATRIKRLQQPEPEPDNKNRIKIGADPEFMLFHSRSGRMIAASEFFPRHGKVGYDNLTNPLHDRHPIAEIRPQPSSSPLTLAENVNRALIQAAKMAPYRNIKWVAGSHPSRGLAIGGHIHFSGVKLNFALLRTLDNFLAIPVFLIENPHSALRRRRRYGTLGNYRRKSYGGFEYRTLGSWLVSPEITQGVLCLAKIAASHYPELSDNYLVAPAAQRAFYSGNQEYFRPVWNDLWSKVCKTSMYKVYADKLEMLYLMIKNGERWDEKEDLRKSWKITHRFKRNYYSRQT